MQVFYNLDNNNSMKKKINLLMMITYISFLVIIGRLFYLQVIDNNYYLEKLSNKTNKIVYEDSSLRGRIYDKNNNLLVDNGLILTIIYQKEDDYDEIKLAYEISKKLELDYTKLTKSYLKDFYIMGHENAFFQYVMRQEEQLKVNSIAMFEYDNDGMVYYRIDRKNQGNTTIYNLRNEVIEGITYPMLFEDVKLLDERFAEVAKKKMRETYISAVYLTGSGFHDKWIEKSKNVICDGRRVFMGQNIYTKGACYHARFGAYEADRNIVFRTKEFITQDIGVMIGEVGGRSRFYPIVTGGREWYNMKGSITLFLDDTNRLEMSYKDRISGEAQKDVIEIHGLPKRPPKTTKLTLNVELYDEKSGAIIIKDTGFGNIYPTTNKIYRREISWAE